MCNVCTFGACKTIEDAAELRGDEVMMIRIKGVDLIAAEAKYHKSCHSQYVSKSNLKQQIFKKSNLQEESLYSKVFQTIASDIQEGLAGGEAFDMQLLLSSFKVALNEHGVGTADGYRSEKLKQRLQNYFGDALVFHKQNDPSKRELIYSSHIYLKEVINAASKSFNTLVPTSAIPSTTDRDLEKTRTLYHAAQIIKADIKTCQGIEIQPLATEELTLNRAKTLIPNSLMKLLSWVITKQRSSDYVDVTAGLSEADERHVLMIGQDILHSATHGRIKTPKHVGLAMSVCHLTGSKQLITMLNRMGHCSSYDEVEAVDTSLAMEVLAKSETMGVVISSNIVPGGFIQAAADNDINE